MKKLIYLIGLLLIGLWGYTQPVVNRAGPANTVQDANIFAQRSFSVPRYLDTTQANSLYPTLDSCGKLIYTYSDNLVWQRSCSPKRWTAIGQRFAVEDSVAHADRFFNLDGNNISIVGGNFGINTLVPTETFSIGHIDGDETVVMYTPDGTVFRIETKSAATMQLLSNTQISIIPDPSSGQLVLDGSLSNYINQTFYTGGGGLAGKMGIGVYDALNDETEFYLKAFDFDTLTNYLTLYDKMKFVDIPNDNAITKIIGIDADDNVRYIDASAIGGTNIYNSDGTLSGTRTLAQSSNALTFSGTGIYSVGQAISGSTARVQISSPATATPHLAVGVPSVFSNNVYIAFNSRDTLTTANNKSTGFFNQYEHDVRNNMTLSGWGFGNHWSIIVPDTMRADPVGSDLAGGILTRMLMKPSPLFTGRHVIKGGTFRDDYVGGVISMIENSGTTGSNWVMRRGYWSSYTAHLNFGNSVDSIETWTAYWATTLNSGHGDYANIFYCGPIGNFDTVRAYYSPYQNAYFHQAGQAYFGSAVNGNPYAAVPSAQVEIQSTTRGILIPRMTAAQESAISSPATYLMLVNTDTARLRVYDGSVYRSVAYLTDIPTGGGGTTWNAITNPTGSQTLSFDDGEVSTWTNGSNTETFLTITSNSLTTGTIISSSTSSLTSGNLTNLVSTSTALASGNELLNIDMSGANGTNAITATGIRISVTNTNATSGTNVGLEATASGATTANIGIRATPSVYVGAVSVNAVDGMRMKNPGNGNYDGYYVESSGGTTGTTYGYAGITRGGGLTVKTTSGSISIAPASGSGVYIGTEFTTATAYLHIKAGTATASTAPLKFTAGTLLSTIEAFAKEANANGMYQTSNALNRYAEGGYIADFYSEVNNSGTTETDLYSYTTKANTFAADGEKIIAEYAGVATGHATAARDFRIYFGGNLIGAFLGNINSVGTDWKIRVTLIRESSTIVRATVDFFFVTGTASNFTATDYTTVTSLTLSGTNILKITGQASGTGAGSDQIKAEMGTIAWYGAANN